MFTVVDFSRKTGDFATLSTVDLKVLALTHMLEIQANGDKRLRTEPVKVSSLPYTVLTDAQLYFDFN